MPQVGSTPSLGALRHRIVQAVPSTETNNHPLEPTLTRAAAALAARSVVADTRKIGCLRSLLLVLLHTAELMKFDATNACSLWIYMSTTGFELHGSALVTSRAWQQVH